MEAGDLTVTRGWAAAFPDAHPLTQGHLLVVPRRHVPRIFDLAPEERAAVWALVGDVREVWGSWATSACSSKRRSHPVLGAPGRLWTLRHRVDLAPWKGIHKGRGIGREPAAGPVVWRV